MVVCHPSISDQATGALRHAVTATAASLTHAGCMVPPTSSRRTWRAPMRSWTPGSVRLCQVWAWAWAATPRARGSACIPACRPPAAEPCPVRFTAPPPWSLVSCPAGGAGSDPIRYGIPAVALMSAVMSILPAGRLPPGGDGRGRIADSMMVCPVQQSVPASGMNPMRCSPHRLSSASLRSMGVSWSPVPNAHGHPGPASMACPVSGSGSRTVAGCAC